MTERSERGQRLDPAGAAAVPPPSMSLPSPPPPSRGWHRFENDRWIGITGPGPALTDEEIEHLKAEFARSACHRVMLIPPDPMEVMIRESAAAYGQAYVYRDPSTGEEHVLDPQWVTIVKPAGPFRIDVPTVPPHVTSLEDVDGDVWLRSTERSDFWTLHSHVPVNPDAGYSLAELLPHGPLVEHPDPRKATT